MNLKYHLFDMVSASIMNNEPLVIVEGKDDYAVLAEWVIMRIAYLKQEKKITM